LSAGEPLEILVSERIGRVSGLLLRPPEPWGTYVLAHGAGAGMEHPFLEAVARGLLARGMATLRYLFPYMEVGGRRPDPPVVLLATVRAAVARAGELMPGVRLFAGGKSMGGRMTSNAAADRTLDGVAGLVFLGFPLHRPRHPAIDRAEHLDRVALPMLFLQGTRDELADLAPMREVCAGLGSRATLHVVEGGDHSFAVLKRSGRTGTEVLEELADTIAAWARAV